MQNPDTDKYILILNSALQCFENFGYKATTVDQIAKVLKIGKGTLDLNKIGLLGHSTGGGADVLTAIHDYLSNPRLL